ncbi:MAG: hypothetical protein RR687_13330, partial [Comamonas sp.]
MVELIAHRTRIDEQRVFEVLRIAFDGDGDRVVLIDEKGVIISADRLLSLFAHMCLADHPEHEVVFDV